MQVKFQQTNYGALLTLTIIKNTILLLWKMPIFTENFLTGYGFENTAIITETYGFEKSGFEAANYTQGRIILAIYRSP